jgi:HK97 family phage major capsid protein
MAFETITLGHTKIATIVVLTEETVRFSNPAAEALVSADMRAAIVQYSDAQFIDPTVAVSGTVRPASISNGAQSYAMGGTTIALITTDIAKLFAYFSTNNLDLSGAMFVMHPRTALYLSMLRTTQDIFAFPGIGIGGGTFFGVPVITSNSVPIDTGADTYIFLVSQPNILLADDGGVSLDISREASLVMDSSPSNPATSTVSLWQSNLVGLRAERTINYRRRRDAAVVVLEDVSY